MNIVHYTPDQLIAVAQFTEQDRAQIRLCRRPYNRLGFGYQLPELLIEVDNHLKFTRYFMSVPQQERPHVEAICAILATIIAHGCNIGPYTMAQ